MHKALSILLLLGAIAVIFRYLPSVPMPIANQRPSTNSEDRVTAARSKHGVAIQEKYRAAGVTYPGEIFIRCLKREAELELWARSSAGPFHLVAKYPILASSGHPGPKRREGDRQVPEGFYEIDRFNPQSSYHLSLGLNYPNAADRMHADPQRPGGDIFIHGSNVSIGCAPIGDDAIEEVYLAALDALAAGHKHIAVHVFPGRMAGTNWLRFAAQETARRPELAGFWEQLRPVYEAFERQREIPGIEITAEGRYTLRAR